MPKKTTGKGAKQRATEAPGDGRRARPVIMGDSFALKGVDEVDQSIIEQLRTNGRTPVRDLAALTGLTEATVRSRLKRLEENDTLRVTATVNLEKLGQHYFAPIGIVVKGRKVEDVANDLVKIPEIVTLMTMVGMTDIELQVLTRTLADLDRVMLREIPAVRGVAKITSSLAIDVPKYNSYWMPFK